MALMLRLLLPGCGESPVIFGLHDSGGERHMAGFGCRLGSWSADDFDANPGSWTMVKKFLPSTQNGNGNAWTRYGTSVNTGSFTVITIAFKLGCSGSGAPTVGWDSLRLAW